MLTVQPVRPGSFIDRRQEDVTPTIPQNLLNVFSDHATHSYDQASRRDGPALLTQPTGRHLTGSRHRTVCGSSANAAWIECATQLGRFSVREAEDRARS